MTSKYTDCELSFQNKTISLHGYKDDVQNAKTEILILLNDKVINENIAYKGQLQICKNIQWLYEQENEWKPFPLYLNSIIENAHEKKISSVKKKIYSKCFYRKIFL